MNVHIMMFTVAVCYTITSLSDKYAVSGAKFEGHEFTFLMCASMSVFLTVTLPFQTLYFTPGWQSGAAILLIAVCKLLEFEMSALVLRELTAFELKAWLGITLFASYLTDVFYGADLRIIKLIFIMITILGLVCISHEEKGHKVKYRKIVLPLIFYLVSKYCYGLVIKAFSPYVSSTLQLLVALVLLSLVMLTKINPVKLVRKNQRGVLLVGLARIPNVMGMLLENAVIAISLVNYSFIQPLILVNLFWIGRLRKEQCTRWNLIGSLLCVIGVIAFQVT